MSDRSKYSVDCRAQVETDTVKRGQTRSVSVSVAHVLHMGRTTTLPGRSPR